MAFLSVGERPAAPSDQRRRPVPARNRDRGRAQSARITALSLWPPWASGPRDRRSEAARRRQVSQPILAKSRSGFVVVTDDALSACAAVRLTPSDLVGARRANGIHTAGEAAGVGQSRSLESTDAAARRSRSGGRDHSGRKRGEAAPKRCLPRASSRDRLGGLDAAVAELQRVEVRLG